jgi:hypothetical protein
MNSKEQKIISKLFAIAEKQQKILMKLAQVQSNEVEANKQFLKTIWQQAGSNVRVPEPEVTYTPGSNDEANGHAIVTSDNYTVTGEVPEDFRPQFLEVFKNTISSQKPELDGKVSTIFKDVTAPVII